MHDYVREISPSLEHFFMLLSRGYSYLSLLLWEFVRDKILQFAFSKRGLVVKFAQKHF